jgi:uncharacterized membrane protein YgcG
MSMLTRIAVAALLLFAALAPAKADERILRFVSDVDVRTNGDLLVNETITVRAEGAAIKHGILRDFPTVYTRHDGTEVEVGFDVLSVTRDGAPENFTTERLTNGWRVRIGRADTFVTPGPHDYAIKYRTTRQVGFFTDFDELYWNATGTGWNFPIDSAEARITLPEAVPFKQSAIYTGTQGSKGKDAEVIEQRPGYIVFRTTRPLPVHNGLTVAAGWPKGVVTPPSSADKASLWLTDNAPLAAAAVALALVLGYYVFAWRRVARDPRGGAIVPLFTPPKGMSAAAVRYVWRMGVDDKTFTAALIDVAVQGHHKLVEKKKGDMTLVPRDGGQLLGPPEQAMELAMFGKRKSPLDFDNQNCGIFQRAQAALAKGLYAAYGEKYFHNNTAWSVRGLLVALALSILVIASVFLSRGSYEGSAIVITALSFMPALIVVTIIATFGLPRTFVAWPFLLFGCVFSFLVGSSGYNILMDVAQGWTHVVPAALPLVLVPIASSAFGWMKSHTAEGRKAADEIEGFRQYLGVAERDRLNALNPPQDTPELFEKYLPYAIALDVENAWGKRFAGVLAAMAIDPDRDDTWYSGCRDWVNDPQGFSTYLRGQLKDTIASAATPPGSSGGSDSSSSGSDGGGSSGGGGGGCGGSGW